MSKDKKTCKTCKYSDEHGSSACFCKRHAPIAVNGRYKNLADWPIVKENDWCGEWEAKDEYSARELLDIICDLVDRIDIERRKEDESGQDKYIVLQRLA